MNGEFGDVDTPAGPPPEQQEVSGGKPKPVILVVDADAGMRESVRSLLGGRFEVLLAGSEKEALEVAGHRPVDLILMEVIESDMDGFGLLAALRKDVSLGATPVLLLCSRADEESRTEALEAGADDCLSKPFTARELVMRIEAQLTIARLRKDAAERQSALSLEVQQARQFAWEVLEHIPDSFATLDREYRVTYMNAAASRVTAGTGIPHLGESLWELYPMLLGTPVEEHFRRAMEQQIGVQFEQYFRTDDAERWYLFQIYPQQDGLIVYMRDTTEARRTEQALRRSEQLAAAGRLAASIAHEINNPLEAVTNLLYLVRMDDSLSAHSRGLLDVADRELQRLSHITSRSLKFYRQRTAPTLTSIEDLIESVLFFHESEIKLRGIELQRRYRPAPAVLCFAGEIQQVLTNLISNALEATPEVPTGKGCLTIGVRPARDVADREGVSVTIADNGVGMDRWMMDRLFHPFMTTKGESGNGLGLWVSKGIVDKHHGTIRVRSQNERGTVFRMFLPLDTTEEQGLETRD